MASRATSPGQIRFVRQRPGNELCFDCLLPGLVLPSSPDCRAACSTTVACSFTVKIPCHCEFAGVLCRGGGRSDEWEISYAPVTQQRAGTLFMSGAIRRDIVALLSLNALYFS